jgi:3-hydroxyacyl-CoA dehydrogenase
MNDVEALMNKRIRKVAVLGAGVMGSAIAAHMTNIGLAAYLLDIVPPELDPRDAKKGLTRESPAFRDKFASAGLENALKARPAAFYAPENARLITTGNFEDNLDYLKDADWVIEAVVEDLEIKKTLFRKIAPFLRPDAIVTTNASGLSVNKMGEALGEHREFFLGTHFFNPPRYMKLMEIIPAEYTGEEVLRFVVDFFEKRLGKRVVFAKDTPNFISNRIGVHSVIMTIKYMLEGGYTTEEADAITGEALGRPRSATLRTLDIVGVDTLAHICRTIIDNVTDDAEKNEITPPEFIARMIKEGLTGEKRGKGFYRRVSAPEGTRIETLDLNTFQYVPQRPVKLPILDKLKGIDDAGKRANALVYSDDRAGQLAWKVTRKFLLHSAARLPEIADDIVSVDRAMKWGFNHELGPFELWDAIGVKKSVEKMKAEGERIPENVSGMLGRGRDRFYLRRRGKDFYYDFNAQDYRAIEEPPRIIRLNSLKDRKKVIKSNSGASLIDIGEGVACLEFHSPHNTIDADVLEMLDSSIDEVAVNWEGMVIGGQGRNFCIGANLMLVLKEAEARNWENIDAIVRQVQGIFRKIKLSEKPVVAAPYRNTLGGGCEICLAASRVLAFAETYIGLVEVGVGLTPAGGGCMEMLVRNIDCLPAAAPGVMQPTVQPDLVPHAARAFETIVIAKVSASAREAQTLGYLSNCDGIAINPDYLLHDAREMVVSLANNYIPRRPRADIRITGRTGFAAMDAMIYFMKEGAFITEHDALIGRKLANVIAGGNLPRNTLVTEEYLLDLERESFLSLCGEPKSQARMKAMLMTGRPLKN